MRTFQLLSDFLHCQQGSSQRDPPCIRSVSANGLPAADVHVTAQMCCEAAWWGDQRLEYIRSIRGRKPIRRLMRQEDRGVAFIEEPFIGWTYQLVELK